MKKTQKGSVAAILIIVVILAITAGVFWWTQTVTTQSTQVTQSQPVQTQASVNSYKNASLGFELQLPDKWTSVVQNEDKTLSNILFYDEKYENDVKNSANALLAIIDKNIPSIALDVNSGDFVKKDFDIKQMVTLGAGGPGGKVYNEKLLSWDEKSTANGQKFYVYSKEIQAESVVKRAGIVWVADGKLFELKTDDLIQNSMMENMAMSFNLLAIVNNVSNFDKKVLQDLVINEVNKYPELKDFQKYDNPGVFWKNENKKVMCLNSTADAIYATVKGKAVVENLVNKITSNLKQQGFEVSPQNTAGSDEGAERKRIGLEKNSLKCTIIKSANEQKNDTTKNKYHFSFDCAELTKVDESNFDTFSALINNGPGVSVACINKNDGFFMSGGVAGFEDDMGPIAGASVLGKNVNGKWEVFITQDLPTCSFVDGFSKSMYDGNCFDKNEKIRNNL